mmetsp:Transcript_14316/g.16648  ORF Transcript_14316/g.16648 Transcript_14316/m.16648 type:complete len:323 (+) Transcript_14316:290-1258(+)
MGTKKAKEVIKLPETEEELRHVLGLYERKGHPGCVGSVDCVHVIWDQCPAGLHSLCTGKEKVPTLAFEVVSSHTKKILAVTKDFPGTYNDKTISKYDEAIKFLRDIKNRVANYKWKSLYFDGDVIKTRLNKGCYFICDGGYCFWDILIPPYKNQMEGSDMMEWSKQVESTRKDIECVFGILKKRFLVLKHAIRFQKPEEINDIFTTCCVLHNLILDYDGYDSWENVLLDDEDEEAINVEYGWLEELGEEAAATSSYCNLVSVVSRSRYRNEEGTFAIDLEGDDNTAVPTSNASEEAAFHLRRSYLVDHYKVMQHQRALNLGW